MFVASRVEFGDECKAAAAVLPHVIGNIETATGCGTIMRSSGVAVQVMVGDPVCQDDVIETAADGQIGIRFIDGTVFNLSHGTRVVLTEFVCDSDGNPHSALFEVTRGTFAFFAGQLAKTGSLRVDTPVGSIRPGPCRRVRHAVAHSTYFHNYERCPGGGPERHIPG